MKKALIISLIVFQLFSCQKNDKKSAKIASNNITMEVPKCLYPQLKAGYSAEKSETDYPNYEYKISDLDCSIPLLERELQKKSFKFLSPEDFSTKVYEIFHRKIDYGKTTKYLYVDGNNACNKEIIYNKNSDNEMVPQSYYLVKNKSFITELFSIPEIIDYQKEFPESIKYEEEQVNKNQGDVKITKWSEDNNLAQIRNNNIEKLVSRNLFLFNDKNEQLTWLLSNDESFLEMLCKVYGYDNNDKINQHFIKKIIVNNSIDQNINFFVNESCDKKLVIHENFINSFNNTLQISKKSSDAIILKNIASRVMSSPEHEKFSKEDKVMLVSYLANVFDPLFKTYHNDNTDWGTLTILADAKDYYDAEWNEVTSIIVKNNYYNLPNLKMSLDYANQFDSVGAPD